MDKLQNELDYQLMINRMYRERNAKILKYCAENIQYFLAVEIASKIMVCDLDEVKDKLKEKNYEC